VEEEEEEEQEQERVGRKGSVDRLSGGVDPGEVDSDDDDDMLLTLEGYQVADFASSMLAAISCWHSRARALLSLGDATVRPAPPPPPAPAPPPHPCLLLTRLTSDLRPPPSSLPLSPPRSSLITY